MTGHALAAPCPLRCAAGTPAAPTVVPGSAQGGDSSASLAWQAVPTATSYTLTAKRSGSSDVSQQTTALTDTLAITQRGAWALQVTASNAYTPTGIITHTASTSAASTAGPVTVGEPDAPVLLPPTGGIEQLSVTFT